MDSAKESGTGENPTAPGGPKPLRACCACKPTKNMRDECIRTFGFEKCDDYIQAHNACLREKGFKVVEDK
jgi:hypothetical protein